MSYTKAQAVDAIFDGDITDPKEGREICEFCEGLRPTDKDRDWVEGSTVFHFGDGSAIKVHATGYEVVS